MSARLTIPLCCRPCLRYQLGGDECSLWFCYLQMPAWSNPVLFRCVYCWLFGANWIIYFSTNLMGFPLSARVEQLIFQLLHKCIFRAHPARSCRQTPDNTAFSVKRDVIIKIRILSRSRFFNIHHSAQRFFWSPCKYYVEEWDLLSNSYVKPSDILPWLKWYTPLIDLIVVFFAPLDFWYLMESRDEFKHQWKLFFIEVGRVI